MKPIKVEGKDIYKAIESGDKYIQIGERKFLLMEVEEIKDSMEYVVNDPDEERQLLDALNKENPILTDDEILKLLRK